MTASTSPSSKGKPDVGATNKAKSDSGEPTLLVCEWQDPPCSDTFTDPEVLYIHLCDAHIGRKSTGNLTLRCKWKNCEVECVKRDHITSHLRVHTPLKPHDCEVCGKAFKRPQDLKKHERIHTEEHHIQHKHSKAITVNRSTGSAGSAGSAGRPIVSLPLHATASSNTASSAGYGHPYAYATSAPGGQTTNSSAPSAGYSSHGGLSTAQLVQQQHEMNAQSALHAAAQQAAQQAYHTVLVQSGLAPAAGAAQTQAQAQSGAYGNDPNAAAHYAAYANYMATLMQHYPQHYAAIVAHHQQQQGHHPTAAVASAPATSHVSSMYPDLAALQAQQHHASHSTPPTLTPAYSSVLQPTTHHQNAVSRGPSPFSVHSSIATSPPGAFEQAESRRIRTGLLGGASDGGYESGSKKRSFDEAAQDVLAGLKKGRYSGDNDMEAIDRLAILLSTDTSPAPALEHTSSSVGSGSSPSSPHSSGVASSQTPPSDFDWLADRAEADKMTDFLATLGGSLEASANQGWTGEDSLPLFEPTAAPAETSKNLPSFTRAPAHKSNSAYPELPSASSDRRTSSGSVYPSLSTSLAGQYPAAYGQSSPFDSQVRMSRPLAPAQIAPFEAHNISMHQQTLLQRAPPSSSRREAETIDEEDAMDVEAPVPRDKYAESVRSTAVKLPPIDRAPERKASADQPQRSGTTLPSFRSLFGSNTSESVPGSSSPARMYPSLAALQTPSDRSSSPAASSEGRPTTADSLAGRVDSLNLDRRSRSNSSSAVSTTSSAQTVDDASHKRSRLGQEVEEEEEDELDEEEAAARQTKQDEAQRRLAVVHALILKVNELHREAVKRKVGVIPGLPPLPPMPLPPPPPGMTVGHMPPVLPLPPRSSTPMEVTTPRQERMQSPLDEEME